MVVENKVVPPSRKEIHKSLVAHNKGQDNKRNTVYCSLALVVANLVVYWPTFSNQFQLKWDDWWVVMNEYTEGGWSVENISRIVSEFYHGQYAPINELFYLALYSLFGYAPGWFHAASLAVHITNVLLVFFLVKRLLIKTDSFKQVSVLRIAFITSLLMAVHPFLVEAVAWISASKCILFALFYLLALHAYLSYISTRKLVYFLLVMVCFAFSFGGKEQAVTLPACLLLFDYTLKRKMNSTEVWLEKLPFFLLSLAFIVITFFSQQVNGEGVLSDQPLHPWYQNVVFAAYSVSEYFIKTVLPLRLSYLYPFPSLPGDPLPLQLWAYPVILAVVTVGFWKFWRQRWVAFGILFFLVQASVVSNLIPTSRYAIIADRYVYLAAVGVFFLIAYLCNTLLEANAKYKIYLYTGVTVYLLCIGTYAHSRTKVWRDSDILKAEMKKVLQSRSDYQYWKKKYELPD